MRLSGDVTIEDHNVVDIVSIDPAGNVVLTISDHLEWTDAHAHLVILQEKMNRYLAFIESGEILERYPDAKNRNVVIEVVFQSVPDPAGREFLEKAKAIVQQAGFKFHWKVFTPAGTPDS
jgi:hypothetical protein